MNRIQLLEDETGSACKSPSSPRQSKLIADSAKQHASSFFVPLHYEPNYAYPLIVWLHGAQDRHDHLKQVMPHISVRNYVAVAPASPRPATGLRRGRAWDQTEEGIFQSLQRIEAAIEQACARFHIARHRIFLAGLEEGGSMALRIGMSAPSRFAGVASVGGPFPRDLHPMSNLIQARRLPILIAHGRDSKTYSMDRVCDELRLFHVAGMSLNLRQYPCGQELTTQMLSDLNVWMMQLVTGVVSDGDVRESSSLSLDELN